MKEPSSVTVEARNAAPRAKSWHLQLLACFGLLTSQLPASLTVNDTTVISVFKLLYYDSSTLFTSLMADWQI